jgi:hypothetical protein
MFRHLALWINILSVSRNAPDCISSKSNLEVTRGGLCSWLAHLFPTFPGHRGHFSLGFGVASSRVALVLNSHRLLVFQDYRYIYNHNYFISRQVLKILNLFFLYTLLLRIRNISLDLSAYEYPKVRIIHILF